MTTTEMRPPPVRNLSAAEVQITADQILKDADIHRQVPIKPPVQRIMDEKELQVYKQEKRREFEDKLRRQRYNPSIWVRYGQWEENLKEFARARSIFERALEIDYTNKSMWLKYAEMEEKNKFVNHARNIFERATYYLPREEQFWFKYAEMEERLGEYIKVRDIFKRWMEWMPGEKAWMAFIKFEERMGEFENARNIYYMYLAANPALSTYLQVAKFELKNRNKQAARQLFEKIITDLGSEALQEDYFLQFAKFEIKQRELDRARQIFQFGLKHLAKHKAQKLYSMYLNFEKEHGTKLEIDKAVVRERGDYYRKQLEENSLNYDAWIALATLQESNFCNWAGAALAPDGETQAAESKKRVREIYEQAISHKPPAQEKRFWRRYMYLWYNYAHFEESIDNLQGAQDIYERALKLVPHKKFTFGKLWIFYAQFCLRSLQLDKARKLLGRSIGIFPKAKVFRAYIEIEEQLCQLDRVRSIFQKYCECFSSLAEPYIEFASFELRMEEIERAKAILKAAVEMNVQGIPDPDDFVNQYQRRETERQAEDEEQQNSMGQAQEGLEENRPGLSELPENAEADIEDAVQESEGANREDNDGF